MARARNIKPGFFKNEGLGGLPLGARLLFVGLWTLADREGRLEDRPGRIKAELFPYDRDISTDDIDSWLNSLAIAPEVFIVRYAAGKSRFILISNFTKHQNPHVKEQASLIPAPDEDRTGLVDAPGMHQKGTGQTLDQHPPRECDAPPDSLNPDSLNADSLNADSLNPYISSDRSDSSGASVSSSSRQPNASRRRKSAEDPAAVDWFENHFWPQYPRKDDRKNARKAALLHGNMAGSRSAILEGLISQLSELTSRQRQFIPLATSWLNGERWRDPSDSADSRRPESPVDGASQYPPVPTYEPQEEDDVAGV